jgi:hypothetical protein
MEGTEAAGVVGEGTTVVGVGVGHGEEAAEYRAHGCVALGDGGAGIEVLGQDLVGRHRKVDGELADRIEDVGEVLLGAYGAGVLVTGAGGASSIEIYAPLVQVLKP